MPWTHSETVKIPDLDDYSDSSEPSSYGSDNVLEELGGYSPKVGPQSATKNVSSSSCKRSGPSFSKIASMSELHTMLQRERYRGNNTFDRDSNTNSNSNREAVVVNMATASARASLVHVPKPSSTAASRAGLRVNSVNALMHGGAPARSTSFPASVGRAVAPSGACYEQARGQRMNKQSQNTSAKKTTAVPCKPAGSLLDVSANTVRKNACESSAMHASEVKALIQNSKDHQVDVFAKLTGKTEEHGLRHKRKAAHERLRVRAIPKMKMSRQKAIVHRLQHDISQLGVDSGNRVQRLIRSDPLSGQGASAGPMHAALLDKRDSTDSLNDGLPTPRSRRHSSLRISNTSSLGSDDIPSMTRRTTAIVQPTFSEIERMVVELPISKQKVKFLEIPRLRSRFHNRGGKILNSMFHISVETARRKNEQLALSFGLSSDDWSYVSAYLISASDLQAAALRKKIKQQVAAVRMIQANWVAFLMRRNFSQRNLERDRAAIRIQRWCRRLFASVSVHRMAKQRLKEQNAAIKVQAFLTSRSTRKRIQLEREVHHLIYQLSMMQSKLGVSGARKLIRLQACIRGFLSRRQCQLLAERRCSAASSHTLPECAQTFPEPDHTCDSAPGGEPSMLDRESGPDRKLATERALAGATCLSQFMPSLMLEFRDHQYCEDDEDSCISTRSPSTRLSYHSNSVRISTASPRMSRFPSAVSTARSFCSSSILPPTPPGVRAESQRPHSSCAGSCRPFKKSFRPSLPKRPNSVAWSPLLVGRSSSTGRWGSPFRAISPGRANTPGQ